MASKCKSGFGLGFVWGVLGEGVVWVFVFDKSPCIRLPYSRLCLSLTGRLLCAVSGDTQWLHLMSLRCAAGRLRYHISFYVCGSFCGGNR